MAEKRDMKASRIIKTNSAKDAIRDSVALVKTHSLVAADVRVGAFMMNPAAGTLRGAE